jgi:2-oxoglutarate ferredoxin oxidoreductase subunit alpha
MESGLDRYSAYPMTPASTIIDEVAGDSRVTFFQWEDEIAVSMSMLWAKFAWKRAMCGTSGWWFALMTESISFSNQAEIWWVYILSQRDGPSTGTPTFTGQWDLDFALHASFGETYPIVIAPDTFINWYTLIWKALNWSDIYQHPVIYITDKQFSESYLSINPKDLNAEKINRWEFVPNVILSETKDIKNNLDSSPMSKDDNLIWYKRYQLTDSGVSPYTVPWLENWEFITTSYEHDEYGATNEDPKIKKQMTEKRAQKIQTFIQKEFNKDFYWYEIINPNAKKFFITFWFNRYVLESTPFIKGGGGDSNYWLIVVTVLQPLDPRLKKRFKENEKNISELTFVEMNHWWTFQKLISNECNLRSESREKKIKSIRKYDLYPIFQEEIK